MKVRDSWNSGINDVFCGLPPFEENATNQPLAEMAAAQAQQMMPIPKQFT